MCPSRHLRRLVFVLVTILSTCAALVVDRAAAAGSLELRSVAEGGPTTATHVAGSYVYVGAGNVLVVKSSANPAAPVEVSDRLLGGDVRDIESSGDYLYVAASEAGLIIFDVSNPSEPIELSTFDTPGGAVSIALSGAYAFIADGTGGLRVVDISNPEAPVEVGSETTSANVTGVVVEGTYAYLSGEVALLVLDISNPAVPAVTGSYDFTVTSTAVSVQGDHAYLLDDIHLLSFDVSDKTAPAYLSAGLVDAGKKVVLSGNHAFVPGQSGMRIFDVSDPSEVAYVGTAGGRQGYDVTLAGNLAYVAYGVDGYGVRDVTDVTDPQIVFAGNTGWNEAKAATFIGDYAYVAATEGLLKVVDVSDTDHIAEIGNMEFVPFQLPLDVTAVACTGSYAYVAQAAVGLAGVDMEIIDVTDPTGPVHVGTFNDPANAVGINTMKVIGNYLYTAKGSFGLRIYDIAAPLAPAPVGNFYTNGEANDFVVDGAVTYVLDGSAILGLRVVDTSNPSAMVEIGNYWTPGVAKAVAIDTANQRLFVADQGNGLIILDVSDPTAPVKTGDLTSIPGVNDVAVSGDVAYLTDAVGVHIVDISDPVSPQEVGVFDKTSGGELHVVTRGDDVFVLDRFAGIYSLFNGAVASGIDDIAVAPRVVLEQNAPNPFNPSTVIRFTVGATGPVTLEVYDVSGRRVRTLVDGVREAQAAPYRVAWDGRDDGGTPVASGVYFYRLETQGFAQTKKMVLLK